MNYLTITETKAGLLIKATNEGRDFIQDHKDFPTINMWYDILEDYSCNGSYELVAPEEIGALTDSPLIALDVERDDHGILTNVGEVFYFNEYMIVDEIEQLEIGQTVFFNKA